MNRIAYAFAAVAAVSTLTTIAAAKEDTMIGYYENTLVTYITNVFENRTWINKDGSVVHFNAGWKNGQVVLDAYDAKWKLDDGYVPRIVETDANGKTGIAVMHHNHFPGQTWRMLQPD